VWGGWSEETVRKRKNINHVCEFKKKKKKTSFLVAQYYTSQNPQNGQNGNR